MCFKWTRLDLKRPLEHNDLQDHFRIENWSQWCHSRKLRGPYITVLVFYFSKWPLLEPKWVLIFGAVLDFGATMALFILQCNTARITACITFRVRHPRRGQTMQQYMKILNYYAHYYKKQFRGRPLKNSVIHTTNYYIQCYVVRLHPTRISPHQTSVILNTRSL